MAGPSLGFMQPNAWDNLQTYGTTSPVLGSGMASLPEMNWGSVGSVGFEPSWSDKLTGYKLADGTSVNGFGGMTLGALSGLGNLFMGMQNYGLAKDQLKFQKDAYNKNYAAQKQTTNASLEDRQRARVASNPTAYQSVSDYMTKNGIA